MDVQALLDSKIYVRNEIHYPLPKTLVSPFLDEVGYKEGDALRVQVQNEVINQNEDGSVNIAYPRFLVEYTKNAIVFGDTDYHNVFGMLVAMDQQHPQIKVYSGMNVVACTNLCIFQAEHLFVQNLNNPLNSVWNQLSNYVAMEDSKLENYARVHEQLINTYYNNEQLNNKLGYLLRNADKVKLGTSPIVGAVKLLSSNKSPYYVENSCSAYNLYNAITQCITDSKDILYKPDKTYGLTKLLV